MNMVTMMACLLLVGCSSMPLKERYAAANACGTPAECPVEWEAVYRAEERAERRELAKANCPAGLVKYTAQDRVSCITPREARRILQGVFR